MKLNILGDPEATVPQNELDKNAMGGTCLLYTSDAADE